MPLIPKDFNFRWSADLSIPIKSAVFEIFPWFFLSWVVRYSFSKCFRASFKGEDKDFSKNTEQQELLLNAPKKNGNFFTVPKVIE